MYSVGHFGFMILDDTRMNAYLSALQAAVTPDSVVLDIGTGTGVFAFMACRYGARHVYAVEPLPPIHVGQQSAYDNGYADRITFIQGLTTNIELPEKVDIIIGDLRGQMPINEGNIEAFADARKRFAKPSTIIIPQKDVMWIAPAAPEPDWHEGIGKYPWLDNKYDLDLSAGYPYVINHPHGSDRHFDSRDVLLADETLLFELDYYQTEPTAIDRHFEWIANSDRTLSAWLMWFDAHIDNNNFYSGAPGKIRKHRVYGQFALPLEHPCAVAEGDKLELHVQIRQIRGRYIWAWDSRVTGVDGTVKCEYKQSNFTSQALALKNQLNQVLGREQRLNPQGQALQLALAYLAEDAMDETDLRAALMQNVPQLFPNPALIDQFIAEVRATYIIPAPSA